MSDPVSRLLAAIEEAERKALAVPDHLRRERWTHPGPWVMHGVESRTVDEVAHVLMTGRQAEAVAEHIAHNDPAAALRRCAADLRTWDRHLPKKPHNRVCTHDGQPWPCLDFRDLADRYGISVEEGDDR